MGGAGSRTRPVVQRGLRVHARAAVVAARPGAHGAVGVAPQTLHLLCAPEKALRTGRHTQALVEEVILVAVYTHTRTHTH